MRRWSVALLVIIIVSILGLEHLGLEPDRYRQDRAEALLSESAGPYVLEGRITQAEYVLGDRWRVTVDTGYYGRVLLSVTDAGNCRNLPGRWAAVTAELSLPEHAANPGAFDYRNYLRAKGVWLLGNCSYAQIRPGNLCRNPFQGLFLNAASRFRGRFYQRLTGLGEGAGADQAGMLMGMLFGSREYLDEETYQSFQKNGTAHILSVSGLHVGIIYGVLLGLLGKRRRSRMGRAMIVTGLVFYAFLASFSVSVTRALWMILLSMAAEVLYRRYDMLSAACVTASALLLKTPALIYHSGFLLSFSAVVSLAVIGGGLNRFPALPSPWLEVLRRVMTPILAIQLGMAPVLAVLFHYFSLAAFLANLPVVFLSAIIIPLGMVTALCSLAGGHFLPLFALLARGCGFLTEMMTFFNDITGAQGRLSFVTPAPSLWMVLALYLVMGAVFSEHSLLFGLNRRKVGLLAAVLLLLCAMTLVQERLRPELVFVDVGQGDCIHLRTPGGKNFLIDGGGSVFTDFDVGAKVVVPYLLANGVGHLDGVLISHMDADHYGGLTAVLDTLPVDRVFLYDGYENCLPETRAKLGLEEGSGPPIVLLDRGDMFNIEREVRLTVLFPAEGIDLAYEEEGGAARGETDLNSASLVVQAEIRGLRVLLTGDIGEAEETALCRAYGDAPNNPLRSDVLKVPHHGSKYSSSQAFVRAVRPRAAVIQVGRNNRFGHPAGQTLERYEDSGAAVFRTDTQGAVLLRVSRRQFTLTAYRTGEVWRFPVGIDYGNPAENAL